MPPKAPVDKRKQAEKQKVAEDKTFGLKNKNKSKSVQKYIKSIVNNATGAPKGGKEAQERKEKEQKEKELQHKALMAGLFNKQVDKKGRAFDPVAKKKAKEAEEEAIAAGKKVNDEVKKAIIEGVANTIRLTDPKKGIRMSELGGHPIIQALKDKHQDAFKTIQLLLFIKFHEKVFWVDDPESSNPMIRCQEDVDAEVAPDERSIEEIIEERRMKLGPGGTPVTLDTFKAWKEKREADRLAKVEEERKESAKKSGGKGLVGMSGRDLFTYDASLFVDDDDAVDEAAYEERQEGPMSDREKEEDEDDEEEDEEDDDPAEDAVEEGGASGSGARGSDDAAQGASSSSARQEDGVQINADLFLEGGDLPDDLDLEDLEDEEKEEKD